MDEELRPQSNEWESSLQESIAEYLGSLPNKIQSLQGGQTTIDESGQLINARIKKLRRAEQSLRMLPSNLAANFNGRQILEELWRLEFAQRLGARQASILASLEDALPNEDVLLRNTFQQLAVLHASLSGTESVVPKPVRRVVAEGNDKISLLSNPLVNAEVRFKNLGKTLDRVWIVVDYDANLLEVDSVSETNFIMPRLCPACSRSRPSRLSNNWFPHCLRETRNKLPTQERDSMKYAKIKPIPSDHCRPIYLLPER